jgi:predicted house-cleaning NTP pyrophosphatase (Maf/HAM1 superfamily)
MVDLCGTDLRNMSVVLGSSSKWRRQLFQSRFPNLQFTTAAADIDEKAVTAGNADRGTADPEKLTLALAHAKADAILPKLAPGTLLITSDQVLSYKGTIREVRLVSLRC